VKSQKISLTLFVKVGRYTIPQPHPFHLIFVHSVECQILCIWTPWFVLVRPLAWFFFDVLVSFCVFVFCRSLREEWQISWGNAWKFGSLEKSIDRNFQKLTFADTHQNTQSRASPWQKAFLPLIFAGEHTGFETLVVSSKRGTLEKVDESFYMGF
jgi:hypothetical protein